MVVRYRHRTLAFALAASMAAGAPAGRAVPGPTLCQRVSLASPRFRPSNEPLTQAARDLGRRLLQLDRLVEHGAIFYRRPDGSIRAGSIAAGVNDSVDLIVEAQPGETIAGALHTHATTAYYNGDPSGLSNEDKALGFHLLGLPAAERTLRLYVVDVRTATMTEYAAAGHCRSRTARPAQAFPPLHTSSFS